VYLRSGDEPVRGSDTVAGDTKLSLLGKIGMSIVGKPLPYQARVSRPEESDQVAMGRYLVDNIGCFHCHSKSMQKLDYMHPENSKGYMAGGMKFKIKGEKVYASNITPDVENCIGKYTQDEFREAVREGRTPNNKVLQAPMPKFKHLTNEQLDAMYAYIQTSDRVKNKVKGQSQW